ncbi:MAG: GatB/YqeY domain-containing protein [Anaerosomatales bacterium]
MNRELLNAEITQAMRDHDKPRISILRMVKNEIDIREKDTGEPVSDEDVVAALKKVLKQTGETLEGSIKAGTNQERTDLLGLQVEILEGYLPEQVTGDALEAIVDRVLAEHGFTEKREMGRAIGLVVSETGGNCDKAEVARLMSSRLG